MKRFFIIFALVSLIFTLRSMKASAQDLILTTEDRIIEAIVKRIADDYVLYKTYDNPNGPLYEIMTSQIVKISFDNGSERVFNKPSEIKNRDIVRNRNVQTVRKCSCT